MARVVFWFGSITVKPARATKEARDDGSIREVLRAPRYDELNECVRRYFAHQGALNITKSFSVCADGYPVRIECNVPRVSDDHDADCGRVERFITAVFFGDPTEGLDTASPAT